MYKNYIKYIFDFCFSATVFIILFPVFVLLVILLLFIQNGKIFFVQERPGRNEIIFKLIKFKTMTDKKDKDGSLLPDEQRLTKLGQIMRKTSLDEIPQLLNIVKGDMSLIGPRPLLVEYLELYNDFQKKRHDVRPGITGWAQINGRNAISWQEKFDFDIWYVENISLGVDIKIFMKTIIKVFKKEGISSEESVTIEKFTGNE